LRTSSNNPPLSSYWPLRQHGTYINYQDNLNYKRFKKKCIFDLVVGRCSNLELQMMAKQLGSLLSYQYGSIRSGLTDIRWSDEVGRTVDSLFNIWLQPHPPLYCATAAVGVSAKQQEMNSGRTRLANCFITSGQWLPLPTECQV